MAYLRLLFGAICHDEDEARSMLAFSTGSGSAGWISRRCQMG